MIRYFHLLVLAALWPMAAACTPEPPAATQSANAPADQAVAAPVEKVGVQGDDIAWFEGGVDAAFEAAAASGRPLFLYWGAEWCPPCHLVKATVFRSREFVERSTRFVPVYLDGDTPNAQAWGEKFGVLGYPTMIVFSAKGEEITRIPGGSDVQAYANVLDLSLDSDRAVAALTREVLAGGRAASTRECTLLSMYSWGQDAKILADRDEAEAFKILFDACPADATVARSMLYLQHLYAAVEASEREDDPQPLSDAAKAQARTQLSAVLGDKALTRANLFVVMFGGADLARAVTATGSAERERLQSDFAAAYTRIAEDEDIYLGERLYAHLGKLNFERIDEPEKPVSDVLRAQIAAAVADADRETTDVYVRQSVMNTANNILIEAGMLDVSRKLLVKEIGISKQPYYFMVDLADIEQEEGNIADAIGWLKRAYEVSTGPATRFQWGNYYIRGLIDMVPEESAMIRDTVIAVFGELGAARGFYQRPKRQMERLEKALRAWNNDGAYVEALREIREGVLNVCATIPDAEPSRATCQGFLAT